MEVEPHRDRPEINLADPLHEPQRQAGLKFMQAGHNDATAKLVYAGGKWTPDATVNCRSVSFSFYKFPYRLEQTKGTVRVLGSDVSLRLSATAGSQPMRLTGEFHNPGPQFTGWIEIEGNSIAVDDKLVAALPDKPRDVVRSMHPQGSVNVFARMWRDPGETLIHTQVTLVFNRCAITNDNFP